MKFIVSSSALLKQLSDIGGVISSNPIIPILENFLFEIREGKLTVTASDLQTSVISEMKIEAKEEGKIAIPAKILTDTLRNLPEQPVTFTINEETYGVELSSDTGRYKLSGENAEDFPKVPTMNETYDAVIPSAILGKAVSKTLFATGNDELRPVMTGVCIRFSNTGLEFASTDGHRLSRYRRSDIASDNNTTVVIPKKALTLLKNSLPSDETPVNIEFTASNAGFTFGHMKVICRLIDERFPDYENVIPSGNEKKLTVNRAALLNSLKRVDIYANKTTHQIRLKIAGSELNVSAEDLDFSNEADERLSCEYIGEDIEIGFNSRFLIEMMNNLESDDILMELSAPNRAGLIFPTKKDENEDILFLVMPVMLNTYVQ